MNEGVLRKSGYLVWALMTGTVQPETVMLGFGNDTECWRFFPDCDAPAVEWLLLNGRPSSMAQRDDFLEQIGDAGRSRVKALNANVPDVTAPTDYEVGKWAAELQEDWQRREGAERLQLRLAKLREADSDPVAVLDAAVAELSDIAALANAGDIRTSRQAADGARRILHGLVGKLPARTIPTPFWKVNEYYDPLELGKLVLLLGIPGSAKTALAQKIAIHAAREGSVVVWLTELSEHDMLFRDALRETQQLDRFELRQLRKPIRGYERALKVANTPDKRDHLQRQIEQQLHDIDNTMGVIALNDKIDDLEQLPVFYYPSAGMNALKLKALLDRVKAQQGRVDLCVVDHIQLMVPLERVEQAISVRQRYWELKQHVIAKGYQDTAFLAIQHMNSGIKKTQTGAIIPEQEDAAYGGHQEADSVMAVVRSAQHLRQLGWTLDKLKDVKQNDPDKWNVLRKEAFLWFLKARDGEAGQNIPMEYIGNFYDWQEAKDHD